MASGPYRKDPGAWMDPESPHGIVFRGEEDQLRVEVRRFAPVLATVPFACMASTAFAAFEPALSVLFFAGLGLTMSSRFTIARRPKFRTTLLITREDVTVTETGYFRAERRFPSTSLLPPRRGVLFARRNGLPDLELECLEFGQPTDLGFGVPLQILVGYSFEHLMWLEGAITDWLVWQWRKRR